MTLLNSIDKMVAVIMNIVATVDKLDRLKTCYKGTSYMIVAATHVGRTERFGLKDLVGRVVFICQMQTLYSGLLLPMIWPVF